MADGAEPAAADLLTVEASDLERAFVELTSRFRGYAEAPSPVRRELRQGDWHPSVTAQSRSDQLQIVR